MRFRPALDVLYQHVPQDFQRIRKFRVMARNRERPVALGASERWMLPPTDAEIRSGVITVQCATIRPKYCPVRFDYQDYEL